MRLASFVVDGAERWGFVINEPTERPTAEPGAGAAWVIDPARAEAFIAQYAAIPSSGLSAARPEFLGDEWPATLAEFLALQDEGMAALSGLATFVQRFLVQTDATILPRAGYLVDEVELLAPIPRPRLYWGLVANAPSFVRNKPGIRIINLFPLGHQRPQGAAIGSGAPITFTHGNHLPQMAYNVELAVVIGKPGRYIPLEQAMDHVAGYTVVNDVSGTYYFSIVPGNAGRGYSLPESYSDWLYQVTASWGGKKADTLAPMGPYLVTKDEVGDPYDLLMYTRQSGRQRDRAHSGAALLGIERIIAWYSSFASLHPGDVIHVATMGVDGLPVTPADLADPNTRLEVEIENIGTLVNPVAVNGSGSSNSSDSSDSADSADGIPLQSHPSYAVREVARSGRSSIAAPQDWTTADARHFYTSYGNTDSAADTDRLPRLEVPRFLNGPASSLGPSGTNIEIPPRATDLVLSIELAVVVRTLTSSARHRDPQMILGYTPMISLCDSSFADEVVEPARAGERGIPAMYGRWADGFNVVRASPTAPGDDQWNDRRMWLRVGETELSTSTSDYLAGPEDLISTISAMITLFPGDVITLGATAARLRLTKEDYESGVTVTGGIDGLGEVTATLAPPTTQPQPTSPSR